MKPRILIIGAGISGLSTAIRLLEKGYHVVIKSKESPFTTTSSVAAAFWHPYLCNPPEKAVVWSKETLRYLRQNVCADTLSGCLQQNITEVFESIPESPWWGTATYYEIIRTKLPSGYLAGYKLMSVVMDTSLYLSWLLNRLQLLGGKLIEELVDDLHSEFNSFNIIVNCSGLGALHLANDTKLFPIRGQILRMSRPSSMKVVLDDVGRNSVGYVVPRTNDVILGGTAEVGNWSTEINQKSVTEILAKTRNLLPGVSGARLLEVKVGLRPGRHEVRLEAEIIQKDKLLVHNYGHGGAGFTLSWGCAKDVLDLVTTFVKKSQGSVV